MFGVTNNINDSSVQLNYPSSPWWFESEPASTMPEYDLKSLTIYYVVSNIYL